MSRSILLTAVFAVLALVLGGCGDDDVFRTDRPILRITLDEYRVVPQSIVVTSPHLQIGRSYAHAEGRSLYGPVLRTRPKGVSPR